VGSRVSARNIIKYDKHGRISELILTDDSGVKPLNRIILKYDNKGNLIAEDYYYGSIEGEKTKFTYDSLGRVIKKSTTYYDEKPKIEIIISYNPRIEKEKQFTREGKLSEYQSYYEKANVTERFSGTDYTDNGKIESTWDYRYENTFDNNDRLVTRKFMERKKVVELIEYEYDIKGLLIKRTTRPDYSNFNRVEEFKYEYWE
jgi:YD repeat-containing protein